jgi:hypothetical protein
MPPSARSPARPVVALALAIALALPLIAGCPPRRPATVEPAPPTAPPPRIGWRRVATRADLPAGPPAPGSWRIHLLDLAALGAAGATVLRTDRHDAGCPVSGRIGGDRGPGGCDGHLITIESPPRQ